MTGNRLSQSLRVSNFKVHKKWLDQIYNYITLTLRQLLQTDNVGIDIYYWYKHKEYQEQISLVYNLILLFFIDNYHRLYQMLTQSATRTRKNS